MTIQPKIPPFRSLRNPSERPELVVGNNPEARINDPTVTPPLEPLGFQWPNSSVGQINVTGFLRVGRIIKALPLKDGPRLLQPPVLVRDGNSAYVADPDGNIVGVPGIWVMRCLDARWTEDTRRIAG